MLISGLITLESVAGSADLPPLTIGHYYVSGPTPNLTLFHCKFSNPTGLFLFVFLYLLLLAADLIYHLYISTVPYKSFASGSALPEPGKSRSSCQGQPRGEDTA